MRTALALTGLLLTVAACSSSGEGSRTSGGTQGGDSRPPTPFAAASRSTESVVSASGTIGCGPADGPQLRGEATNLLGLSSVNVVVVGEPGRASSRVQPVSVDATGKAEFVVPVRTIYPDGLRVTVHDGARVLTEVSLVRQGPDMCG
jgi:hypothetical protein